MAKKFIAYFVAGVALVAPFIITIWVIYSIYSWIISYYDFEHALIGIFLMLISLILIGYMASSFIGARAFITLESILKKTPLLGFFYKTAKEVTGAFVGSENKFSEPVMVQFPGDIYKIGFITNKNIGNLKNVLNDTISIMLDEKYYKYFK